MPATIIPQPAVLSTLHLFSSLLVLLLSQASSQLSLSLHGMFIHSLQLIKLISCYPSEDPRSSSKPHNLSCLLPLFSQSPKTFHKCLWTFIPPQQVPNQISKANNNSHSTSMSCYISIHIDKIKQATAYSST